LLSYTKIVAQPTPDDIGLPQQRQLFDSLRRERGVEPPVLDARDVQNRPREMLGLLCDRLGVSFQESMLSWAPGLRVSDGVWAKYWYKEVETSTCFRPYQEKTGALPDSLKAVCAECMGHYEDLYAHRLR
jgi:hypothetical protein